jgi:hypothetical protein
VQFSKIESALCGENGYTKLCEDRVYFVRTTIYIYLWIQNQTCIKFEDEMVQYKNDYDRGKYLLDFS